MFRFMIISTLTILVLVSPACRSERSSGNELQEPAAIGEGQESPSGISETSTWEVGFTFAMRTRGSTTVSHATERREEQSFLLETTATVVAVSSAGVAELAITVNRVRTVTDRGVAGAVAIDSWQPVPDEALSFEPVVGTTVTARVDGTGMLVDWDQSALGRHGRSGDSANQLVSIQLAIAFPPRGESRSYPLATTRGLLSPSVTYSPISVENPSQIRLMPDEWPSSDSLNGQLVLDSNLGVTKNAQIELSYTIRDSSWSEGWGVAHTLVHQTRPEFDWSWTETSGDMPGTNYRAGQAFTLSANTESSAHNIADDSHAVVSSNVELNIDVLWIDVDAVARARVTATRVSVSDAGTLLFDTDDPTTHSALDSGRLLETSVNLSISSDGSLLEVTQVDTCLGWVVARPMVESALQLAFGGWSEAVEHLWLNTAAGGFAIGVERRTSEDPSIRLYEDRDEQQNPTAEGSLRALVTVNPELLFGETVEVSADWLQQGDPGFVETEVNVTYTGTVSVTKN